MRVVLTGGSGQLGNALVRQIRTGKPEWLLGAPSRSEMNLADGQSIKRYLNEFQPSLVIHVGGVSRAGVCERNPDLAQVVNVDGTQAIVRYCDRQGARLVYISSAHVFNGMKGAPYVESDPTDPRTVYGRTKALAEAAVVSLSDHVIVRASWLVSATGPSSLLAQWLSAARRGERISAPVNVLGSPTSVPDLADAMLRLAASSYTGVWHLANGGSCSRFELVSMVLQQADLGPDLVEPTRADEKVAGLDMNYALGSDRTGFPAMRPWADALKPLLGDV